MKLQNRFVKEKLQNNLIMKTICPHCKQEYPETPDEYLGMTLQCSVCQKEFICNSPGESQAQNKMFKQQKILEEFRKNYRSLRDERAADRFYSRKYGVILRDGKAYSIYNPLERVRQSRVADFFRAGGMNIILCYIKNGFFISR